MGPLEQWLSNPPGKNPILNNSSSFTGTVIFRPINVTDLWQDTVSLQFMESPLTRSPRACVSFQQLSKTYWEEQNLPVESRKNTVTPAPQGTTVLCILL